MHQMTPLVGWQAGNGNHAQCLGKEGVVHSNAHVGTRFKFPSALSDQNIASNFYMECKQNAKKNTSKRKKPRGRDKVRSYRRRIEREQQEYTASSILPQSSILLNENKNNNSRDHVRARSEGQTLIPNRRPAEPLPLVVALPAFFFAMPRTPPKSVKQEEEATAVAAVAAGNNHVLLLAHTRRLVCCSRELILYCHTQK
jgi:hypothetical protein